MVSRVGRSGCTVFLGFAENWQQWLARSFRPAAKTEVGRVGRIQDYTLILKEENDGRLAC